MPGAFTQSDMEGPDTHMKLKGKMVEILTKIDENFYKICGERKRKICDVCKAKESFVRDNPSSIIILEKYDKIVIIMGIQD